MGRTELKVSVVGVGTAQYRMIPEAQAVAALRRAFSLGVNIVHASPDYEGSLDLVARAVHESQSDIIVCSQGYGDRDHMEYLFQETCRKLDKNALNMFGLACIDDRELLGENVWGVGGQIEFLQRKKKAGQIRNIFCTTHGSPDYLKKIIATDVFDAILFAFNPLGYHLLSFNQKDRLIKEQMADNAKIIHLAAAANIGVMIMKPLAGGLLCPNKAFPPKSEVLAQPPFTATEILQHLLVKYPEIACVMPGTASPEEAEENALAGAALSQTGEESAACVERKIQIMKTSQCSRCGECEKTCSQYLPISWLFRAAYIHNSGAMVFETIDSLQYRKLHPGNVPTCSICPDKTCRCSVGLDIPALLCQIHATMLHWEKINWLPSPAAMEPVTAVTDFGARLFAYDLPNNPETKKEYSSTVIIKNVGLSSWCPAKQPFNMNVKFRHRLLAHVPLRGEIPTGVNAHFSFQLKFPQAKKGELTISLEREGRKDNSANLTACLWHKLICFAQSDSIQIVSIPINVLP